MKRILLFILIFSYSQLSFSQIAFQSFEGGTDNWIYIPSPAFGSFNTTGDIWDIATNLNGILPTDGANLVVGQDLLNDDNPSGDATLTFENISVTGLSNLRITFDFEVIGFDNGDDIFYTLIVDDVPQTEVQIVDGSSNFDDQGTEIIPVPENINTIGLEIRVTQNGGSDQFGLDNFVLETIPPPTIAGFDNESSSVNETDISFNIDIPVTLSNYEGSQVDLSVMVNGGTYETGDLTVNTEILSFTSNGTQNINITINDDADFEDETLEISLSEISSTGLTINPTSHVLSIIDDETIPVRINEVDANTPGTDEAEFVELFGSANLPLDGYVVVFFNGSNDDKSYRAFDLDGFTLDQNGFFLIGNVGAPQNPEITFSNNTLQNGADAVAIYQDNASSFPSGTVATMTNLIDALVYDNNNADDLSLLSALGLTEQINENENGNGDTESIQRGSWIVGTPTPRAMNILPVSLENLVVEKDRHYNLLKWTTAFEINNDYFEILYSNDGMKYERIGKVKGNGSISEDSEYEFIHRNNTTGIAYYKLKQVDFNGNYEIFGPVVMNRALSGINLYPTITAEMVFIEVSKETKFYIYDNQGNFIHQIKIARSGSIDVSAWTPGMYYLVSQNGTEIKSVKLIKI